MLKQYTYPYTGQKSYLDRVIITCEADNCENRAKYALYHIHDDGSKDWERVCPPCEGVIGDRNMRLQGYNPTTREPLILGNKVLTSAKV